MKKNLLKSVLLALMVLVGGNAWAADKTVVKYSFDDRTSPELKAGSRVGFDYDKTSVITSTKFLNAYNNTNGDPGSSTLSLGSTDLSGETWTLSFEWAACGGCNSKADHTTLKAGDTNLFDLTGNSNWNTTVTITYAGSDGTKTLPVPGCNKSFRFSAAVGNQYNTTDYWHHIVVTGSAEGVKMTITNSSTGAAVVENVVLSETNVNPTSLIIEPCCGGGIGLDELSLTYFVEGEVIQTPTANYTAVNGVERTITATCETEGATLYNSTDGTNWTEGSSITVSASGNVYFKAVKGTSESDVLTFAAVAGEAITLNAPSIVRSDNATVTISADQTALLLSPNATIYYEYGSESGSFTGTKVLTVEADATITAYAEATGYTTSATSERAVALFPKYVKTIENTPAKTSGTTTFALSTETITVSEREYAALLLDNVQWGTNVYLQNLTLDPIVWGIRNGNWYINTTDNQWILIRNLKAGDIVVANVTYPAAETVNATYSEKYTFANNHAYIVTADGDVELAFRKINAKDMDYFYGIYAYSPMSNEEIALAAVKAALQESIDKVKALNLSGLAEAIAAAQAAVDADDATIESLQTAAATFEANVKAYVKGYLETAISMTESLKAEALNDAITAAKAALAKEDATAEELAGALFGLLTPARPYIISIMQQAIEVCNPLGIDTSAAEALLEKGDAASDVELASALLTLTQTAIPAVKEVMGTLKAYMSTFASTAAEALQEDFAKLEADINNGDIAAVKTDIATLMVNGKPYLQQDIAKLESHAEVINNEAITADVAAMKAAVEEGSFASLLTAVKQFEADFLAIAPTFVAGIETAVEEYKAAGKIGTDELEAAVTAAKTALAAEDKTIVTVGLAVRNLIVAVKAFEEANKPSQDSYIVNIAFDPAADPLGWTAVVSDGYRDYGMYQIGGEQMVRFAAPTADETHLNTEYAAGFEVRWNSNFAAYTQTVTLPAGAYALSYDVENVNSATTNVNYENRFTVTVGETVYTDEATEWMKGGSAWTAHAIKFILAEEASVTISLGYGTGSNNIGADNTPALYVSHLALSTYDPLADAKATLQAEIDAAKAMREIEDYTEGLETFNAAIEAATTALNNATTEAELTEALNTLKAAETAFREANMFSYQKYVIANVKAEKYWSVGNSWGTQASLVAHPEYVKLVPLPDGKYNMESQVNNGGTSYYFNGDYMDNGSPIALTIKKAGIIGYSDEEETIPIYAYTIANGDNYYGWDGTSTVLGKNLSADSDNALWIIASLDEAKAALAEATAEEPMDATMLIEDHDFGRNNRYANKWTAEGVGNMSGGNNTNNNAESFHSVFTLSQTLTDAPKGIYALTAQGFYRQDGDDNENLPVFFANDETATFPQKTGSENSMSDASVSFSNGMYTIDPIYVEVTEDGALNIGAKLENNTALWCIWDNFVLTYYGAEATMDEVKNGAIVKELAELRAKAAELQADVEVDVVKLAISDALETTDGVTGADAINAAIATMKAVIDKAEASIIAKSVLPKMKELTESTNVYTEEAKENYYGQWVAKYEGGTLTKVEAAALQDPFLVTGWHAAVTVDNFLLSAWDTNPDFVEAPYYINTWSTEGGNDGSNFVVPFFEYWTGDGNSLGEKTLTATMNDLDAGNVYNVTALVRVRMKNGAEAPAYGITFQANDSEAVDACNGDQVGTSQFYMKEVKTISGKVGADGTLKIQFKVAADNNISWLSFKNVKFVYNPDATGINDLKQTNVLEGTIYNLNGQKVNKAQKGLFIINGKKVVVK